MDLSVWVTYVRRQQTLAPVRSRLARPSLPFNLAHAVGNVVFCLAFGPALVRALRRYRDAPRGALARRRPAGHGDRRAPRCSRCCCAVVVAVARSPPPRRAGGDRAAPGRG